MRMRLARSDRAFGDRRQPVLECAVVVPEEAFWSVIVVAEITEQFVPLLKDVVGGEALVFVFYPLQRAANS